MSSEKVIDSLFSSYDNFDLIGNSCDIYRLKKFNKRTNVKKPEHQKTVDQPMTNNSRSFQNVFLATFSEKHWEIRTPSPLFKVGCKFASSVLVITASNSFVRIFTTLNQVEGNDWVSLRK